MFAGESAVRDEASGVAVEQQAKLASGGPRIQKHFSRSVCFYSSVKRRIQHRRYLRGRLNDIQQD